MTSPHPTRCTYAALMASSEETVRARWNELALQLALRCDVAGTWEYLREHYAQPWRAYHNLDHIADCLRVYQQVADKPDAAMTAAILFHDVIYVMGAGDNEARSAAVATERLLSHGAALPFATEVGALIEATDHKRPPSTAKARLLCDIDLSILGAEPARYLAYADAILRETGMTPEAFGPPRAAFLETMLARAHIFHTEAFRATHEPPARENMRAELRRLRG